MGIARKPGPWSPVTAVISLVRRDVAGRAGSGLRRRGCGDKVFLADQRRVGNLPGDHPVLRHRWIGHTRFSAGFSGARTMSKAARLHVPSISRPPGVGVPTGCSTKSTTRDSLTPKTASECW